MEKDETRTRSLSVVILSPISKIPFCFAHTLNLALLILLLNRLCFFLWTGNGLVQVPKKTLVRLFVLGDIVSPVFPFLLSALLTLCLLLLSSVTS